MQCAHCGFARPGAADACPGCGRVFAKAAPPPPPPKVSSGTLHFLAYVVLLFAIARVYAHLWEQLVVAEDDRVESVLVSQAMQHRKQLLADIAE